MRSGLLIVGSLLILLVSAPRLRATQDPRELVRQAVQTEIAASRDDHSRWIYYDVDRRPENTVRQWVAETGNGVLHRVLMQKGRALTPGVQRSAMDHFIHDPEAQAHQRKSAAHDDRQSEELLGLLPEAFNWSVAGTQDSTIRLHFTPDPKFKPPTWAARVFAAMEGEMQIERSQHRIVSLRGKLTHDVRFCGGLCGNLSSGGTFDVERRQIGPSIWQIVETHVHIRGSALFFKNISQEEDEEKTNFRRLPEDISLAQAESELLKQTADQPSMAHVGK